MKLRVVWLVLCAAIALTPAAFAQAGGASSQPPTVTQVLDRTFANFEHEFVSVAEAMPAEKYSFAPSEGEFKGVRTFAQQVKHVAAVQFLVASALLQEKSPSETGGESGPDNITSKADIVKYLKDSFVYAHKAIGTINEKNVTEQVKGPFGDNKMTRLGLGTILTWHGFDHYGQMAVYQRMNGIVPPPSRPKK